MSETRHTPLPWSHCKGKHPSGVCECMTISCSDGPVATVTNGDWGDFYPEIRITDDTIGTKRIEAYTEKMVYGSVPREVAEANAEFIVRACNAHYDLVEALEAVLECINETRGKNADEAVHAARAVLAAREEGGGA